jgi:hypothetical protein
MSWICSHPYFASAPYFHSEAPLTMKARGEKVLPGGLTDADSWIPLDEAPKPSTRSSRKSFVVSTVRS